MKVLKSILFIITSFYYINVFSQIDRNGEPVFNSEIISEESIGKYKLLSGYYTIKNNISDEESSVYVKDKPSTADYIKYSLTLPSYFFVLSKNNKMKFLTTLLPKISGDNIYMMYLGMNVSNGNKREIICNIPGEISEKRAEELVEMKVDSSFHLHYTQEGKYLSFKDKKYLIMSYEKVKADILEMVDLFIKGKEKQKQIKDPEEYIRKESIGGELDFEKKLTEDKIYIYNNIAYNKSEYALVLWGIEVRKLNVKSSDDAIDLWEDIYKKKLSETNKKALENGYK